LRAGAEEEDEAAWVEGRRKRRNTVLFIVVLLALIWVFTRVSDTGETSPYPASQLIDQRSD
jgi:hypothetical protein